MKGYFNPLISPIFQIILILSFGASCTRMIKVEKKSKGKDRIITNTNTTTTTPANTFELVFADETVNSGNISYDANLEILSIYTFGGVNAAGAFQGGGTGNKPIAALDGFHNMHLSDFSLDFDYDQAQTAPFVNILIDIDSDGTADNIVVPTDPSGGSFSFDGSTDSFRVVCVPTCGTYNSFSYDLTDYPDATIVNSTITDGGMPAGAAATAINGVIFFVGSGSNETSAVSGEIFNIETSLD
ncbi:hypothetical protein N9N67_00895 [Bacteriovoracaceae bacterium]|nr:hypothetical protein [Bacteriovoracaceae bacterium]